MLFVFRKRRAQRSPQAPIPVVLDLDAEETPKIGHFIILDVSILCLFAFMRFLFTLFFFYRQMLIINMSVFC